MVEKAALLSNLGLEDKNCGTQGVKAFQMGGEFVESSSPIDGELIAAVSTTSDEEYEQVVRESQETFREWRKVPAPERGQLVREIAVELRSHKEDLGKLITLEMGKIVAEGEGEVQECIDIADFAVGLSRQLYGRTMHSERPSHRMYEQWHPLGAVGVITAFNFPMAVWAWNSMLAAVCGDTVIWKPSEITPLTAVALNKICRSVAERHGFPGLFSLVTSSDSRLGEQMAQDRRLPLISATGSCRMGRAVGKTVAERLGKVLLELGGNNAVVVMEDADLDLVMRSVLFGAVGTSGQRCTSTRRVLIHESLEAGFVEQLQAAYGQVRIGNPLERGTLMGPLIHERACVEYEQALKTIQEQGGEIVCGGARVSGQLSQLYVEPTIVRAKADLPIMQEEVFAPILYVVTFKDIDEAIGIHNCVPQGLSSAMFTGSIRSAERFLSAAGSDCGIANINIGTSGAEIGGAFGGEKDTGGGRESGSDSWKQYMRRQTNTINYSTELPLAQGITFEL